MFRQSTACVFLSTSEGEKRLHDFSPYTSEREKKCNAYSCILSYFQSILAPFPHTFYQCDECRQIFYSEEWAWEFSYKHFQQSRCIVISYLVPVKSVFIKFCLKFLMEILKDKINVWPSIIAADPAVCDNFRNPITSSRQVCAALELKQPVAAQVQPCGVQSRLTSQVPADIQQPRLNVVCYSQIFASEQFEPS